MSEKPFCRICGGNTAFEDAELCTRCWELEHRIEMDPEIARRILDKLDKDKAIAA